VALIGEKIGAAEHVRAPIYFHEPFRDPSMGVCFSQTRPSHCAPHLVGEIFAKENGDTPQMTLTNSVARSARPRDKPYKLTDGHGLYLKITPKGSRLWRLKYRFNAKENTLSFGPYPEVTLVRARELQLEARRLLHAGIDPSEHKKQAKRAAILASTHTFESVAGEWFSKFFTRCRKSHSGNVLRRLNNDIRPWLGSRPIAAIEADELLETIRRTESRGALNSAHRCLRTCGQVFRYAIANRPSQTKPSP